MNILKRLFQKKDEFERKKIILNKEKKNLLKELNLKQKKIDEILEKDRKRRFSRFTRDEITTKRKNEEYINSINEKLGKIDENIKRIDVAIGLKVLKTYLNDDVIGIIKNLL
jgi:predicted lactoylglutathione lyase